jgi:hypothetical protein
MQISFFSRGNHDSTRSWLSRLSRSDILRQAERWGRRGVEVLSAATPVDTGATAGSWKYRIIRTGTGFEIHWYNTNQPQGAVVALLIQYGHGTRGGGYISGFDYINPAMRPVFEQISADIDREVRSA